MYIVRTSSAAAAAAARLRLVPRPTSPQSIDVRSIHPLLVVRGLHEGCASEAGLLVVVLRVLVYYPCAKQGWPRPLARSGESWMQRPSPKPQCTSSLTPCTPIPPQMAQRSSSSNGDRSASVATPPELDGAAPRPERGGSTPPSDARRSRSSLAARSVVLAAGTGAAAVGAAGAVAVGAAGADMGVSSSTHVIPE